MEKVISKNNQHISILVKSFLIIIFLFFSTQIKANAPATPPPGVQLAYFIGFHSYDGGTSVSSQVPYASGYRVSRNAYYWTRWRYVGYGCRQSCLIDRLTGFPVRCNRSC